MRIYQLSYQAYPRCKRRTWTVQEDENKVNRVASDMSLRKPRITVWENGEIVTFYDIVKN